MVRDSGNSSTDMMLWGGGERGGGEGEVGRG